MVDAQIVVPDNAAARTGIQPTVDLTAKGNKEHVTVKAGQSVTFKAKAQVPTGAGEIVRAEWDFDGDGRTPTRRSARTGNVVTLQTTATFAQPGTYLVALRVSSERTATPPPASHWRRTSTGSGWWSRRAS